MTDRKELFKYLSYLIVFIFIINYIAVRLYWYSDIWWFDMPMHFIGGFWIGLALVYVFKLKDALLGSIFRILFFVLAIGIAW